MQGCITAAKLGPVSAICPDTRHRGTHYATIYTMGYVAKTLLALQIAVIIACVVGVCGSLLLFEVAMLAGANNMNGGLAMGVANEITPLIAFAGLVLGLWLGWRTVRRMQDRTAYVWAGVLLVVMTGLCYQLWLWFERSF